MRDITNVNSLSPNKFNVIVEKLPHVTWFAQRVNIPGISFNPVPVFTNRKVDYSIPGDKIIFEDCIIGFTVDENAGSLVEFYKWIVENVAQGKPAFSDITILLLTNNSQPNIELKLRNAYPYMMGSVLLDTTQEEMNILTNDVTFKFSHFEIVTPTSNVCVANTNQKI